MMLIFIKVESIRLTGSAATSMAGFSGKVASTSEVLEVAAAATRQLGLDANAVFGNELLTSVTYLQHELGLTADQAARFGSISVLTGKSVKDINKDISEGASEMNELAKSGVPLGVVLQDVLNASDDITASLGNNPKAITRAATAARALGMDLAKVNSIADGLLDFESSIEAELEAQLLTGKNINVNTFSNHFINKNRRVSIMLINKYNNNDINKCYYCYGTGYTVCYKCFQHNCMKCENTGFEKCKFCKLGCRDPSLWQHETFYWGRFRS